MGKKSLNYRFKMDYLYYNYKFKNIDCQNSWRCILNNTFNNMELYYRKQFSMRSLLSYFKKTFEITPITLKNSTDDKHYKYKLLAIYLLTKYSNEKFKVIANEFNISLAAVDLIYSNIPHTKTFQDDIKLFFKKFEEAYLMNRKCFLLRQERLDLLNQDKPMSRKI